MVRRTRHMSPPAADPRRPGLVWPVRLDPAGVLGPTRAQARGSAWSSPFHGYFLPADLDPALAVGQAIVNAAAIAPDGGLVTGWAALRWEGARHLDGTRAGRRLPVTLAVPPGSRAPRTGIRLARDAYLRIGAREVDGLVLARPHASVALEVCHAATLTEAVAMIDRAAAADLVSLEEMVGLADQLAHHRWVTRLRAAIGLADENCWSPAETTMRGHWLSMGLSEVVCNRPVFDLAGRHLGTPDLLHVPSGVAGEYDGALHLAGQQRAKDIRREAVFRRAGLEYVEMVAADLHDPTDFHQRTRDALDRSTRSQRAWTLDPPAWWVETHTVERRRALDDAQRARFLRWQAG